ncbi:ABC transporter ATP-binding protein [Peribacillus alkalitolerans]|uniref:ABC transporter ATP-binding protein n=1 Tax=Peribacillus alkalitolerans TaxID=1550385 RepID=UPI0013D50ADA|nr:ABC transporter ATP-binding protein [Peribacillus alkalitolerans]
MNVGNLRLKFPGRKKLLFRDLSLSIKDKEKVLLLGPSGCGKSTLLQVLSGIIPRSVEIPMRATNQQLPLSWGYVFQDPESQFCMPYVDEEIAFVLENLQIPREEMIERIQDLLKMVDLPLDHLHTNIASLSGGMKQKLAIASVLALNPDTLFLDEPTALLDGAGTQAVWDTVKKISTDKTLVIVEHKLDHVLDLIERIILFNDQGEIIADGPKQLILSKYKRVLKSQGVWYPGAWEDYLQDHPPPRITPSTHFIMELENFKGFIEKKPKISIQKANVAAGEWIAIVGKNGAGKSTTLHSFMQFIKTTGKYELFGQQVQSKKVPTQCTFVFQNPEFQFVTNSVFDEIAYSLRLKKLDEKSITEQVEELLKRFKLNDHQNQHPFQLSMGQKRRLSVAASIVNNQDLILLDEPTFGQDSKNTFQLLEMLQEYQKAGSTIVIVTHDEHIVEHFATRVWTIEDGKLVSDQLIQPNIHNNVRSLVL